MVIGSSLIDNTENLNQVSTMIMILFDGRKITKTKNPTVFDLRSNVTDRMYLHHDTVQENYTE